MNSLTKLVLGGVALVSATAFVTSAIVSAQKPEAKQDAPAAPDMAAMMEQMMKLAAPGKEHASLMKHAGEWEQTFKIRFTPDAEWTEAKGTAKARPILDGRYLLEDVEFSMMGMPMKGVQILGYDNNKKEYVSIWLDSSSTWPILSRGQRDSKGALETRGTMIDVAGERPFRMVIEDNADGTTTGHMYDTIPPTGEVEVMQIHSKRKG